MDQDRIFLIYFIDRYKCHPAVWNTKSDMSKTNTIELKASLHLVLCKEKFDEADEAFVQIKVNNLQTAFRRELNKVRQSKVT